jgi:hypothetical protein
MSARRRDRVGHGPNRIASDIGMGHETILHRPKRRYDIDQTAVPHGPATMLDADAYQLIVQDCALEGLTSAVDMPPRWAILYDDELRSRSRTASTSATPTSPLRQAVA